MSKMTGLNYSTKSQAKSMGHKKSHGNPSEAHSARRGSTVKRPKSSSSGMQGLSIGQRVPMKMLDVKYLKPNNHGMPKIVDANKIKRGTKKALGGKQSKFFGL